MSHEYISPAELGKAVSTSARSPAVPLEREPPACDRMGPSWQEVVLWQRVISPGANWISSKDNTSVVRLSASALLVCKQQKAAINKMARSLPGVTEALRMSLYSSDGMPEGGAAFTHFMDHLLN